MTIKQLFDKVFVTGGISAVEAQAKLLGHVLFQNPSYPDIFQVVHGVSNKVIWTKSGVKLAA